MHWLPERKMPPSLLVARLLCHVSPIRLNMYNSKTLRLYIISLMISGHSMQPLFDIALEIAIATGMRCGRRHSIASHGLGHYFLSPHQTFKLGFGSEVFVYCQIETSRWSICLCMCVRARARPHTIIQNYFHFSTKIRLSQVVVPTMLKYLIVLFC